jgi:hypothetical protein
MVVPNNASPISMPLLGSQIRQAVPWYANFMNELGQSMMGV